jgi:hypothetical protein
MKYKYDIDTKVTAKQDLKVFCNDDETGEERELIIPAGFVGTIESQGWSSIEGFRERYEVLFILGDSEEVVSFFLEDLEEVCTLEVDNEQPNS